MDTSTCLAACALPRRLSWKPAMTQQQFQQRWCHGDALCSLPGDMQEPPIFFSFFFWWKKAYMSIDANLISNPKDR